MSIVSIGYSALSSSLMVTGEANFRVREDVRITGIKVINPETANGGYETYPAEYYKDGTKVMVTLPETNSTVTYEVEITNSTSFDYYLKSKSDVPSTNPQMKYEIQGLEVDETTIPKNSTMKFKIVVSYQDGTSEVPSDNTVIFETRFVFDILDVTPPTVSFSPMGGNYKEFQKVMITASDEHYDHMDVEVRDGSNEKIEEKSKTGITSPTYEVYLDSYDTYKILVKAYDQRGNTQTDTPLDGSGYTYQEYVIRKAGGDAAEQLKEKMNPSDLTYTDSTDEQKRQMYAFEHDATEQTGELTDYRYIGNDPYNYVYFNCTDDIDTSTCETWRIIGILPVDDGNGNIEERIKIIKDDYSQGYMKWDYDDVNNWKTATLNTYLNGSYYNGLPNTAKAMIGKTKYYLGGSDTYQNLGGPDYYKFERGTKTPSGAPSSWIGWIGLMYPSDYVYTYALGVNDKCYTDGYNCRTSKGGNPSSGWLYKNTNEWTLSPNTGFADSAFYVGSDGYVYRNYSPGVAASYLRVRPALYLASSVLIVDGDGSSGNPYVLNLAPKISFDYLSGTYGKPRTITITAEDTNYSYMNVEVRDSNGRVESKSRNNIVENTYIVTLEEEGTYTVSVMAYDEDGYVTQVEQQYVIKKLVTAVETLKEKANSDAVTSYTNGNKTEMYTFSHEATEQTEALTDYRYIGNTPNNYVYFNCKDDSDTSKCETWRIIGIFSVDDGTGKWEERVKIIKDISIGDMAWDSNSVNNWEVANLNEYLNGTYYDDLLPTAKKMIGDAKYYLGGSSTYQNLGGPDYYKFERGTNTSSNAPFFWVGKIALMYPSDYVYTYALGVHTKCYTDAYNCRSGYGGSPSLGWLFSSSDQWNLVPAESRYVFCVITGGVMHLNASRNADVRPTLYLSASVNIVDGDGSSINPYQLSL